MSAPISVDIVAKEFIGGSSFALLRKKKRAGGSPREPPLAFSSAFHFAVKGSPVVIVALIRLLLPFPSIGECKGTTVE